jgi:hypothetical protein
VSTLKEAESLQQLMNDMTAAGNKAATAYLKVTTSPQTHCWMGKGSAAGVE